MENFTKEIIKTALLAKDVTILTSAVPILENMTIEQLNELMNYFASKSPQEQEVITNLLYDNPNEFVKDYLGKSR